MAFVFICSDFSTCNQMRMGYVSVGEEVAAGVSGDYTFGEVCVAVRRAVDKGGG